MLIKFLAVMMMALITNLAFAANPEAASVRTEVEKADGKAKDIKNDTQVVKKDVQDVKKDTQQVSKDLHQIRK
jgi:peptidoglycan hydrolase CwlO-like protein